MKNKITLILLFLLCVAHATTAQKKDTLTLRVMTYNLRFGELASLEDIAAHIRSFKPDLVALQEVDCKTYRERAPKQNGRDFISTLAYHTGMLGLYGKTIEYRKGYYGIGLLTRFPYIDMEKVMLPNPLQKEPRALLRAKLEIDGDTVIFAVTHLDVFSEANRTTQAKYINQYFARCPYPVIIGGDFNATPTEECIKQTMKASWANLTNDELTFHTSNPTIKIDYLFGRPMNGWTVVDTQTIHSCLSDHRPILSVIQLIRDKK